MTENTTPGPVRRPRPVHFPRQLIVLVSEEVADEVDATAAEREVSKGEVLRTRLELGRILEEAYSSTGAGIRYVSAGLRDEVRRLAQADDVTEGEALAVLISWAVKQTKRPDRNARHVTIDTP